MALNCAVAIGFADGAEAGLEALDQVEADGIPQPHLLPAARAEFLARVGRRAEARNEFALALELVGSEAERRHLAGRLAAV